MAERKNKWLRVFAWGLAAVCVGFVLCVLHSTYALTVNSYAFGSGKLGEQIRIVVAADLHEREFGRGNEDLIRQIQTQEPDLIFLVGDFVNSDSDDCRVLMELVEGLEGTAPIYFAPGNHELAYMARTGEDVLGRLAGAGVTVLDGEYIDVTVKGQQLRIGGLYDYAFALDGRDSTNPETMDPETYGFLTDFQQTDRCKIMLSHRPESFVLGEASVTWDVDLVISGHAHGGQAVLPFLGGLWAPEQGWLPEYVHGLYEKDKLNIFITSGLGSSVELIPRFNNPPEIAVVSLK